MGLLRFGREPLKERKAFTTLAENTDFVNWLGVEEDLASIDDLDIHNVKFTEMCNSVIKYAREKYKFHANVDILNDKDEQIILWQFMVYDMEEIRTLGWYNGDNDGLPSSEDYELVLAYCIEYLVTKFN